MVLAKKQNKIHTAVTLLWVRYHTVRQRHGCEQNPILVQGSSSLGETGQEGDADGIGHGLNGARVLVGCPMALTWNGKEAALGG